MQDQNSKKSPTALREEEILAFWQAQDIFKKSLNKPAQPGDTTTGNFVTYDGPPFATGLPHYGHILPGTMKDVIPRYQTMRGKRVLRRWGWDCHGLPVENLIEKELGLQSKKDIETFGVKEFNAAAKASVFRYRDEWKKTIPRLGRWVDMDNDYRTMDTSYTESVWWSFKTLFDKNLVYKSFKSMQICPRCETTLSNFEVNLGYKDITDISAYVKFELADEKDVFFVAWTTTPWTLPGNVALAVNPDVTYVRVRTFSGEKEEYIIVAKDCLSALSEYFKDHLSNETEDGKWEVVQEYRGSDLVGKKYLPVFLEMKTWLDSTQLQKDQVKNKENGWQVYAADFVTTGAGTGIVHIAPMYGEDDFQLAQKYDLPLWHHVEMNGVFKKEFVPEQFWNLHAKPKDVEKDSHQSTDIEVIKYLAKNGALFAKKKIVHSYPHCWRCETPLLNYATSSWFVRVTDIKEKMFALNEQVAWVPKEVGANRFGNWIEGARDWAVSRLRYWGAPLPVWEGKDGEAFVAGSIDDIKKRIKRSGNRYFAMRHGETEGNVKKIWSTDSHMPDPLTQNGREKVQQSAHTFVASLKGQKVDFIVASPYPRTQETAQLVADILGIPREHILTNPCIGEWDVGQEYNGKDLESFFAIRNASADRYNFKTDSGESYADVIKRTGECLYDLEKTYQNKNILIVSHGGPVRALSFIAQGFLRDRATQYMAGFHNFDNAEIRELDFAPLPHNDDFEVDLHRPFIDDVEVLSQDGSTVLKRVPEVFDSWYDSGSMPFAQNHYPFENKELFEQENSPLFPADFIAEGLDQTRGWFYTLLALGTGLFDTSPYKNVIVNGLVLAEDGRKMSKSLKNYPDPFLLIDTYGADSVRYYLMSSSAVEGEDLNFSEKSVDELHKKVILRLQNVVSFYEMYANEMTTSIYDAQGKGQRNVLDKWIWARLAELRNSITAALDEYKIDKAARPILDFVDDLSTWYIRRSRERFKSDDQNEKNIALVATGGILYEFSKLIAPFMPFIAEDVYQKVKKIAGVNAKESVHLDAWPTYPEEGEGQNGFFTNPELLEDMKKVRQTVTVVLEARQKAGIKVRQPLAALVIKENLSADLRTILAEEVNVKEVVTDESLEALFELDTTITPDLREEGIARDLIRSIQEMRKEKNLMPKDVVTLSIQTDAAGQAIVEKWKEQIMKTTNSGSVVFGKVDRVNPIEKKILTDGITFIVTIK